jgi:hypothetical protein
MRFYRVPKNRKSIQLVYEGLLDSQLLPWRENSWHKKKMEEKSRTELPGKF